MNTAKKIQFIKDSRGLHLDSKFVFKSWFCLPIMMLLIFFSGKNMGILVQSIAMFVIFLVLLLNFCYFFCKSRKVSLKHKLFIRPVVSMNIVFPLFLGCSFSFYDVFGLKNFFLLFVLPIVILTVFFVIIAKMKMRRKSKTESVLSVGVAGATAFLISHRLHSLMSEHLSDMTHFIIISVLMILLSSAVCVIAIFDLQRYYYFTRLEKAGLVTEDVLKPEA